jgi:putative ATPase
MDNNQVASKSTPLANQLRPSQLSDYVGQSHLLSAGKPLYHVLQTGQLHSMIFWGPPGVGKTTLAELIAQRADAKVVRISAVLAGVKDLRAIIAQAEQDQRYDTQTVLFIDEVHRFNKSQQDALLPHVEKGTVTLIGATTENPSFELNNALMSRARVYVLQPLTAVEMLAVIDRAGTILKIQFSEQGRNLLAEAAGGDARRCLNLIEVCLDALDSAGNDKTITVELLKSVLTVDPRRFDKGGDLFYEQISACHKAVRGSDPDAALYWFCCMLEGGCDPLYLGRRLLRMASEDIGNADPRALDISLNAVQVYERLGSPEGELALAQALIYLACAPKSNAVYKAYEQARQAAVRYGDQPVPMALRNAPTTLLKNLGYSDGYRYAHDEPGAVALGVSYFPEKIPPQQYYSPVDRGLEIKIKAKLDPLRQLHRGSK